MVSRSPKRADLQVQLPPGVGSETDGAPARSILIVAPSWPYPPTWGFAVRVYQLARHLAARHRVTLLTYSGENATGDDSLLADWLDGHQLVPPPARGRWKRARQVSSLASAHSDHMSRLRSSDMTRAIGRILEARRFDIVQVESSQLASTMPECDVPIVLDEHNVEFMLLSRIAGTERGAARSWFGRVEAVKARRDEIRAWSRADGVVFTSESDLAVMRRIDPEKRGRVVANGVDVQDFAPSSEAPERDTIVFVGSINYRPNTDAVDHFTRHVFPSIRRLRPSARFVVVGQGAPDWLVRAAPPGVEFTGFVDDVRPYLRKAAVVVAPLRSGSGTRLKILEALAMEKAVVTTRIGCEGLAVVDGEHLSIADEPDTFAQRVVGLMSSPDLAAELGARGRELVVRDYSWSVAARRLEQFHAQLIGKAEEMRL